MNSEFEQSYMDKLKMKNIPPALRAAMEETAQEPKAEQAIPMVQISEENWNRLCRTVQQLQDLSMDLTAQRADLKASAESYAASMTKAAQEQTEASEKAIQKIANEATEQVGNASERASRIIERSIYRDEAIWFLRLALTFLPTILIFLLWLYVGLRM